MKLNTWLFAESYRWKGILGGVVLAGAWIVAGFVICPLVEGLVSECCLDVCCYSVMFLATILAASVYLRWGEPDSVFSYVWAKLTGHFLIVLFYLCDNLFQPDLIGNLAAFSIVSRFFEFIWLVCVAVEICLFRGCRRILRRVRTI